jgi:hypothetical protein
MCALAVVYPNACRVSSRFFDPAARETRPSSPKCPSRDLASRLRTGTLKSPSIKSRNPCRSPVSRSSVPCLLSFTARLSLRRQSQTRQEHRHGDGAGGLPAHTGCGGSPQEQRHGASLSMSGDIRVGFAAMPMSAERNREWQVRVASSLPVRVEASVQSWPTAPCPRATALPCGRTSDLHVEASRGPVTECTGRLRGESPSVPRTVRHCRQPWRQANSASAPQQPSTADRRTTPPRRRREFRGRRGDADGVACEGSAVRCPARFW